MEQLQPNIEPKKESEEEKDDLLEKLPEEIQLVFEEEDIKKVKEVCEQYEELPQDLKSFWHKKWAKDQELNPESVLADLRRVHAMREKEGYKKIRGYHVFNKDLKVGSYIKPGRDGAVFYSDDIENLYGKYGGGWLYVVEGTNNDEVTNDELGWRKSKSKMKIIDKIRLDEDSQKKMNWKFADVEYH